MLKLYYIHFDNFIISVTVARYAFEAGGVPRENRLTANGACSHQKIRYQRSSCCQSSCCLFEGFFGAGYVQSLDRIANAHE